MYSLVDQRAAEILDVDVAKWRFGAADVAVVVPTLNEIGNIRPLLAALDAALAGYRAEILFVDDWSTDGTPELIAGIARARGDVRLIRRYGRRGLASAVIEGMMATTAEFVAVIDADMQHDESILPRMIDALMGDEADVVVGSRYCEQGSCGEWSAHRVAASRAATRVAQACMRSPVGDPMSGFFAVRRDIVVELAPRLSGRGFKILLDILMSARAPLRVRELPYRFRTRMAGESKLGAGVIRDYALLLLDKAVRDYVPSRLVSFACVGLLGVGVHLAVLRSVLALPGASFPVAQACAVLCAIAFNFFLNNAITFHDRKLKGARLIGGLASFYLVCGVGALGNVGVGSLVYAQEPRWWVAGLAGAVAGSVWNFASSSFLTWRRPPSPATAG